MVLMVSEYIGSLFVLFLCVRRHCLALPFVMDGDRAILKIRFDGVQRPNTNTNGGYSGNFFAIRGGFLVDYVSLLETDVG